MVSIDNRWFWNELTRNICHRQDAYDFESFSGFPLIDKKPEFEPAQTFPYLYMRKLPSRIHLCTLSPAS
jgi:hypothetical protein